MMSQLVVRPSGDAPPAVHIEPVQGSRTTLEPGTSLLHLGSQDLIRFAGYAVQHGFVVSYFEARDLYLSPLEPSEEREVSQAMLSIFVDYGAAELEAAMRDEFDGLYVVAVTVLSQSTGFRIDVRRSGFVDTSVADEAERLINSAWRELHLS